MNDQEQTKFTQIGNGFVGAGKNGKKYIRLSLDKNAKNIISDENFSGGIFIFRSDRNDKNNQVIYDVSAKMPLSYDKDSEVV